jgi:hypothetical protein
LVKKHGEKWLGRLSKWLRAPSFHLGVLDGAAVKGGRWELGAATDWLEWSTLRALDARGAPSTAELLKARALKPVSLNGVAVSELRELFALRGPLAVVTLNGVAPMSHDGTADWSLLADWGAEARQALPHLRHLSLGGSGMMGFTEEDYEELLASPIARQLETLSLQIEGDRVGALVELLPGNVKQLECRFGARAVSIDLLAKTLAGPSALVDSMSLDGFRAG